MYVCACKRVALGVFCRMYLGTTKGTYCLLCFFLDVFIYFFKVGKSGMNHDRPRSVRIEHMCDSPFFLGVWPVPNPDDF